MPSFLHTTHLLSLLVYNLDFLSQEIQKTGIRAKTDPRLSGVIQRLSKYRLKTGTSLENLSLDFDQFRDVLAGNLPLLTKIFRNDLIIPEFEAFVENVTQLYKKLQENFNGDVSL